MEYCQTKSVSRSIKHESCTVFALLLSERSISGVIVLLSLNQPAFPAELISDNSSCRRSHGAAHNKRCLQEMHLNHVFVDK